MSKLPYEKLSYEGRLDKCQNPLIQKLFRIILTKESNLCVAANFDTIEETLEFVDKVGSLICILKIQSERFKDDNLTENLKRLYEKKKRYNFLLFEDRKFFDGEETVRTCYRKYVPFVDLVTVVPTCGDGIFKAIQDASILANLPTDEPRGCLAVCELSFAGSSIDSYKALEIAERNSGICVGIIAQKLQINDQFKMFKATPGVHLSQSSDGGNQQWNHPEKVVLGGADVIIVGRGIVSSPKEKWEEITRLYKETAFIAYNKNVTINDALYSREKP